MSKVALCLSGEVRNNFKEALKSMKENIIDITNCDIFLFIKKDDINRQYFTLLKEFNLLPKVIIERKDEDLDLQNKDNPFIKLFKGSNTNKYLRQAFFVTGCNNIKKYIEEIEEFKYSWVIRSRLDMLIINSINLDNLDNNFLYTPYFKKYEEDNIKNLERGKHGNITIYDRFAFGSSEIMDIYGDWYNVIHENKIEVPKEDSKYYSLISVESQLRYILDSYNINYKHTDLETRRTKSSTS